MTTFVNRTLGWVGRREHPLWAVCFRVVTVLQGKLAASPFSRNVSVMLVGTVLGQATSVLLSPALTRLYSPEQFGALGVFMSTLNILVVLAALRYEIPMSTAQTSAEVVNLFAVSVTVLVLTTTVVAVAAAVVPVWVLAKAGLESLDDYRPLMPVGFACLGLYYIALYYATWAKEFRAMSQTRISQGLSGPLSQIAFGLLHLGTGGLALGFVIGQSSGTILLLRRMVFGRLASLREVSLRGMRHVAWQHRGFPLISAWAGLIDMAGSGQLVYILLAVLYPGSYAGFMFLSERVVARPLQMVSTSLLTVFMAEIGQTMHRDPALLRRRFFQVTSRQFMVGAVWVVAIDVVAAVAFPLIFGQDWAAAVPFLLVMSVAYLVNSVISAVAHTLNVLKRQVVAATWQVGRVTAVCLGFTLSVHAGLSAFQAICIYASIQVVACIIMIFLMKDSIERLRAVVPPPGVSA